MTRELREVWRVVPGFEGAYEVSSLGAVRSIARRNQRGMLVPLRGPRVLRPCLQKGYEKIHLCGPQGGKNVRVHHLVLLAFCGPRPHGAVARHLNGQRRDNRVENLKWGTDIENHRDMDIHGTRAKGCRRPEAKLTDQAVMDIRSRSMTFVDYAKKYGVSERTVRNAFSGKTWAHVPIVGEG